MGDLREYVQKFSIPVPETGCWLWTGAWNTKGYGMYQEGNKGKKFVAHRVAYRAFIGDFDDRLLVCHRCDTRACVNPAHLFLGTHEDNMRDMIEKGRPAKGGRNARAKLTSEDVIRIRREARAGADRSKLAASFGVFLSTISDIIRRDTWAHIPEEPECALVRIDGEKA